jgi:oligopeptide transport system substrate-binding protein
MLTPSLAAQYAYMLWPIKNAEAYNGGKLTDFGQVGVKALDPLTLQITLDHPAPYLPALAAHTTWLPVHQSNVEQYGRFDQRDSGWAQPGKLVGNGPFVLKSWIPNAKVVVEKNPRYYDAAQVRLNRIEFFPMEDRQAEESAFRAGQLHVTYGLPHASISRIRREQPEILQSDTLLSSFYLFFNVRRPPFDNPKLRRALSLAVDRDAIAKNVLLGTQQAGRSLTPPNCGGYTARASVPTDIALAKKLLAEAGYPDGRGLPSIEVLSYQTESFVRILEVIQAEWAKNLGIHISITPLELKMLFRNQHQGNFAIAGSSWIADYPDPLTFLGTMESGGGNNWAGWSDKTYDELLQKAAQTPDSAQRFEYFQEAEARLLEQAPLIPLFFENQNYLKQPAVRGWVPSKLNFHRFKDLWLEK